MRQPVSPIQARSVTTKRRDLVCVPYCTETVSSPSTVMHSSVYVHSSTPDLCSSDVGSRLFQVIMDIAAPISTSIGSNCQVHYDRSWGFLPNGEQPQIIRVTMLINCFNPFRPLARRLLLLSPRLSRGSLSQGVLSRQSLWRRSLCLLWPSLCKSMSIYIAHAYYHTWYLDFVIMHEWVGLGLLLLIVSKHWWLTLNGFSKSVITKRFHIIGCYVLIVWCFLSQTLWWPTHSNTQ